MKELQLRIRELEKEKNSEINKLQAQMNILQEEITQDRQILKLLYKRLKEEDEWFFSGTKIARSREKDQADTIMDLEEKMEKLRIERESEIEEPRRRLIEPERILGFINIKLKEWILWF